MGGVLNKAGRRLRRSDSRVLLLGLDGAGKTTILYRMKLGEPVSTIPTIGFNVEVVRYKNLAFTVWDVGGQERIRQLWKEFYPGTRAVIFVVDSSDTDRLDEARGELVSLLSEEQLRGAVLLVFANKQDLPLARTAAELTDHFGLEAVHHQWCIQPCCGITSEGLLEGLDWLSRAIRSDMR
mmetsp:Transcript_50320/g.133621  ORF Transcript_50320/g.133621 Transcript_50320/m.133621 type:complete len:181 (-) Transcript_50320:202-744(-)